MLQIVFEAIRGRGFSSDVALDDIKLSSGGCPPKQRETRGFVKYPFKLELIWTRKIYRIQDTGQQTMRHIWMAEKQDTICNVCVLKMAILELNG